MAGIFRVFSPANKFFYEFFAGLIEPWKHFAELKTERGFLALDWDL
jgi:hypothetical protein